MKQKAKLRVVLLVGMWFLALGGFLLHLRVHAPGEEARNLVPFLSGLLSLLAVPLLFTFRRTVAYGYVINGMLAIIGTVTMAAFSWNRGLENITAGTLFLNTLFPDIAILWAKFALGLGLFELEQLKSEDQPGRSGRFWRYPNMGWWGVHAAALSTAFTAGFWLWP
jgi:hypothetical protein